jgi:hypothetical protein
VPLSANEMTTKLFGGTACALYSVGFISCSSAIAPHVFSVVSLDHAAQLLHEGKVEGAGKLSTSIFRLHVPGWSEFYRSGQLF